MKKCTHCEETKPLTDFYFHAGDQRHFNRCKECVKRAARERFQEKRSEIYEQRKPYRRKYDKEYRSTEEGRLTLRENERRRRHRHPDKERARKAVQMLLPSASERRCYHCENQACDWHHHNGYSFEHRLDVIPLCHDCHCKADALQRAQENAAITDEKTAQA